MRLILLALLIPFAAFAAAPVGERLYSALDQPLTADPSRFNTASLSTTLVVAASSENTKETQEVTQLFVVTNYDGANAVCFGTVSSLAATCDNTLCDTAASWGGTKMNCTEGDANMGSIVPMGQSRPFRYNGTRCPCIVASGASTAVQVERVVR